MDYDDFFSLYDNISDHIPNERLNETLNDDEKIDVNKILKHIKCQNESENDDLLNENSDILDESYCKNCKNKNCVINDGEIRVCTNCGMEHGSVIDDTAEWRYYGSEDNKRGADPNRCGMPNNQMLGISSLSTVVIGHGFESYRKLSTWYGLNHKERELIKLLNYFRRKCNMCNLPESVTEKTIHMWKMISEDYIKRGTPKDCLYAACFVHALKDCGIMRSTDEICELFDIKQKKLTKGCNEFIELMYYKDKKYVQKNLSSIGTKDLCAEYAKLLDYPEEPRQMSIRVAILVNRLGICGSSNPKSISVGILYLISEHYKLNVTKKQISDLCKVSDVTISNTYNKILKYKKFLIV
jgi:transcription initiation factor TFIIB